MFTRTSKYSPLFTLVVSATFLALSTGHSPGTTNGSDNAADAVYTGGVWVSGTGGGSPTFGPWTLSTSNTTGDGGAASGFFIGDSTGPVSSGNGAGTGDINTSGVAFGMYAHKGNPGDTGSVSADATRQLDSALAVNQTLSLQVGVNFRNGDKGIDIYSGGTNNIFNLNIGGDTYAVNNATTGNGDLFGDAYDSQTIFTLSLMQTSVGGGTWTIVRSGGLSGTATGTYTGDPTGLHIYNSNTDANSQNANNLYFNNFSVVPEPASYAMAISGFGILVIYRRLRGRFTKRS